MIFDRLTSLDLHLPGTAGAVVETRLLEDAACGIYPAYYRRLPDRLHVATSAAALILDAGSLEANPGFTPREYLLGDDTRQRFVHGTAALPKTIKNGAKRLLPAPLLRALQRNRFWYESWETLDRRVAKLRPFETVTPQSSAPGFHPDFSLTDADTLVDGVVDHLNRFVRDIEERYPDHEHVILVGGRDSQILLLIPKQKPDRWHVFSAAPNHTLVADWMVGNGLRTHGLFLHDNQNDEEPDETEEKIVCSDLYSDPRHLRWLPALRRIAQRFGGQCCFWSGSAADALHVGQSFHRRYQRDNPAGFFDIHLTRVPCLVGNYHQVVRNFTGCPLLCPYQSAAIWRDVYRHHGPAVIPPGCDLRPRIGERLAGRPIRWITSNPAPAPYRYPIRFHAGSIYRRHLENRLRGAAA